MSNHCGGTCEGATESDRAAVDTENLLGGTPGGFRTTREGVENVSVDEVAGDGPFAGVRPKAGGVGTADDWDVLSVIGDSEVLRIDPMTDSVCEGDNVRGEAGTGLRGGEGCKVGGDMVGGRGLRSNGLRYRPHMGLVGGRDGSDTVCG